MSSTPLTVVAVCSYNRARSVMVQLLLQRALDERGIAAEVIGAGFNEEGLPPLHDTVVALRSLGVDATQVRSRRVDTAMVEGADLVLAAEKLHVVRMVEDRLDLFAKTFTFPEFVARARHAPTRAGRPLPEWLAEVGEGRTHAYFLGPETPEISDPAGLPPAAFDDTATRIEAWCRIVAGLL